MKLLDLEPEWLTPDMFVFKSPSGKGYLITCKRVPMSFKEQYDVIYAPGSKFIGKPVVQTKPDFAWKFEGNDFNNLTIYPSIDASASGNWHGFITNGEIT